MEKSPELKKSGLDQTKHREKELARTAMSENIDTEKGEHENGAGDKIKEYKKNKEAFAKNKEKYSIIREGIVAKINKSSDESSKKEYQEELRRLRVIEDYSAIQYISHQGKMLIGYNPDLDRKSVV